MDLQNIVIDFDTNTVTTYLGNKLYEVDLIDEILVVKSSFELAFNVTFSKVVIQLTEDQHYSEPRILCQSVNEQTTVKFADISVNHAELFTSLHDVRILLESELNKQL
jgi:hypothetical protein